MNLLSLAIEGLAPKTLNQLSLEDISAMFREQDAELEKGISKMQQYLPKDMDEQENFLMVNMIRDATTAKVGIAMDIAYEQGIADRIKLIMQAISR